jgi:hypothetical protein
VEEKVEAKDLKQLWNAPEDEALVIVNQDIPRELELMLIAALMTYSMGNKSIDYMLNKYRDHWEAILESKEATHQ